MKINNIKYFALTAAVLIFFMSSCGGPAAPRSGGGALHIVVKNSKSFNPNIDHGQIITYRLTVTGSGIETPIVAEFDGSATGGQVDGIPAGSDRQVEVKAINANGLVIRAGEKENVQIRGGQVNQIDINLESVPIFTNIADGNTLDNTRLIFKVFADPDGTVVIEDITGGTSQAMIDASTSVSEVNLDISTGLGSIAPVLQPPGQHTYRISNIITGRSSTVSVNLRDGSKRRGAPFFAGGDSGDPSPKRRLSCGTH